MGSARSGFASRQRSALPIHFKHSPHHYGESDDEEDGHITDGDRDSGRRPPQRPFRRFDPTAYQQEKQRKLRMNRSQSLHSNGRAAQRSGNTNGGYTSDSSAGGYSSAASNDSNRSNRRGRSRARHSAEHQRAVADRLSSPKRVPDANSQYPPSPRTRASLPRPAGPRAANTRARSPSPASVRQGNGVAAYSSMPPTHPRKGQRQQGTSPPPPPPAPTQRSSVAARKRTPAQQHGGPLGKPVRSSSASAALLADTTADSFSDIDDRLNALQQFLKEAKRGGGGGGGVTLGTSTAAKKAPE